MHWSIFPGYWLFHCHIEYHVELGMAIVFKVGEDSDYPSPPPNFPRCNNYTPHRTTTPSATTTSSTEAGVPYKIYKKSETSEIEFDIDNTLGFLAGSKSTAASSNFTLVFVIIFVLLR